MNFNFLIEDLVNAYNGLKVGLLSQDNFEGDVINLVAEITASYQADNSVLSADNQTMLEDLIDRMVAEGDLDLSADNALSNSVNSLISDLGLGDDAPVVGTLHEVSVFNDVNGDGVITADELVDSAALDTDTSADPEAESGASQLNVIAVADINQDGVIDAADLGANSVQIVDINGNGVIDSVDVNAFNHYTDLEVSLEKDANADMNIDSGDVIRVKLDKADPAADDSTTTDAADDSATDDTATDDTTTTDDTTATDDTTTTDDTTATDDTTTTDDTTAQPDADANSGDALQTLLGDLVTMMTNMIGSITAMLSAAGGADADADASSMQNLLDSLADAAELANEMENLMGDDDVVDTDLLADGAVDSGTDMATNSLLIGSTNQSLTYADAMSVDVDADFDVVGVCALDDMPDMDGDTIDLSVFDM